MSVGAPEVVGILGSIGLLFAWSVDRAKAATAERRRREEACPHRPEWQETIRMNTHPLGRIVPGQRMLVKRCRGCGLQRPVYRSLQSWDAYIEEFRQETRDRTAEFRARRRVHMYERARTAGQRSRAGAGRDRTGGRVRRSPWQPR